MSQLLTNFEHLKNYRPPTCLTCGSVVHLYFGGIQCKTEPNDVERVYASKKHFIAYLMSNPNADINLSTQFREILNLRCPKCKIENPICGLE